MLVFQGARDPLNDARGRAAELGRLCARARVELCDAGHCPQDERPDEFNGALLRLLDGGGAGGAKGGEEAAVAAAR